MMLPHCHHAAKVPVSFCACLNVVLHLPNGIAHVANDLYLREIDRVYLRRIVRNVDNLSTTCLHKERRLFNHVVANVENQIRSLDGAVHKIALRERGATHEQGVALIHHAFTKLGGYKGNAGFINKGG